MNHRTHAVLLLLPLLLSTPALANDEDADNPRQRAAETLLTEELPGCGEDRDHCIGLDLFIALDEDGAPVVDATWLNTQLDRAAHHYAPVSVGFEVTGIAPLDADETEIETRSHRNHLGRDRFQTGTLQIYIVRRLANVDDPGDLYGVHWRDRADMKRTWVILSSRSWPHTMAHEIGHFFELPHSDYDISIMNKSPRSTPPADQRTFHTDELDDIRKELRRKIKKGRIAPR